MAVQMPKWKSFTLPNVERGATILKDPVRSITTRQFAPISEADVLYQMRDQTGADRLSENIQWLARGVNPSLDVVYNNSSGNGARTLALHNYEGSNPYKLQVVRPPIFTLDALQPLSRQRYRDPAVRTNPSMDLSSASSQMQSTNIDRAPILSTVQQTRNTSTMQAQPSLSYRIALPTDILGEGMAPKLSQTGLRDPSRVLEGTWHTVNPTTEYTDAPVSSLHRQVMPNGTIVLTPLNASAQTNPSNTSTVLGLENGQQPTSGTMKSTNKQLILGAVQPNFALIVHDNSTNRSIHVPGTIQDRQSIAVQAALGQDLVMTDRSTGQPIKIKDYRWKVVQSAAGSDALVLTITPDNNLTQQKLQELTLNKKISGGAVNAPIHNLNAGVGNDYRDGVRSMQARSTNPDVIHTPGPSMFYSAASQAHSYQGGSSISDRSYAAGQAHLKREARKARASDVQPNYQSTATLPSEPVRTLRLRKNTEAVRV